VPSYEKIAKIPAEIPLQGGKFTCLTYHNIQKRGGFAIRKKAYGGYRCKLIAIETQKKFH
jgi:hypothetical protein